MIESTNNLKVTQKMISQLLMTMMLISVTACDSQRTDKNTDTIITHLKIKPLSNYTHGKFGQSAAEITAFDATTQRGFVVNSQNNEVDVLDLKKPAKPKKIISLDFSGLGSSVNSVAVSGKYVAVAVQANKPTDIGSVVIIDAQSLELIKTVKVGAMPDMLTFTPNGQKILVANEGQPSKDYMIDPVGSVSIIDITNIQKIGVKHIGFEQLNNQKSQLNKKGIRITGKDASVAQDLEPEYITVSDDSAYAYVTLQENNAVAQIDINNAKLQEIHSFGYKDHSKPGNGLDVSDKDDQNSISTWPLYGMYQPDAIANYKVNNKLYLVTANEGDSRNYKYTDSKGEVVEAFSDMSRVHDLVLDDSIYTPSLCGAIDCTDNKALGRLQVANTIGDSNGDGIFEKLYSFGTRSFSIWDISDMSKPVYDSGSDFAKLIKEKHPNNFNASNDSNKADKRSDNKGVEPEGIVLGKVGNQIIAFIGLERISSIVAYNITNPKQPLQIGYINTRTFNDKKLKNAKKGGNPTQDGDLGPEGLTFISAQDSPTGKPLLFVGYEVSGNSRIFELQF